MKKFYIYIFTIVVAVLALASCEQDEDYTTVIDAPTTLVYMNTEDSNWHSTTIMHKPTGSIGSYELQFPLRCNTSIHDAMTLTLVYDADAVTAYNEENGTEYSILPEDNISIENASLTLAANEIETADSVTVSLTGDLSALTDTSYLCALVIVSSEDNVSSAYGTFYLEIDTETNIIKPLESADDMMGFLATTTGWTADCDDYSYLFDGSTSTEVYYGSTDWELTIDMKQSLMVTGLGLYLYGSYLSSISIEYSDDEFNWSQAGTPTSDEYVYSSTSSSSWYPGMLYIAVYDYFEARYIKLDMSFKYYYYSYLCEVNVYMIESTDPTIYAETGTNNVETSTITHKQSTGVSSSDLSVSFPVSTTITSSSGYNVTATVDNSLIDTYNSENGTSYVELPSEYLSMSGTSLIIPADSKSSEENVTVGLTGDVSRLTEKGGYLIPIQLATTTSGATVSSSKGVVYITVDVEFNYIATISSTDDIPGYEASGVSSWSADCDDYENLFDSSTSTYVAFSGSGNSLTVDMQETHYMTGLYFYGYPFSSISIEYSSDGTDWNTAGTPTSGEYYASSSRYYTQGTTAIGFTEPLEARYVRLSFSFSTTYTYYTRICEMSIYEAEENPVAYANCGTDNVLSGTITWHTTAGQIVSVSGSFTPRLTEAIDNDCSVGVTVDNSLVSTYNSANGTSYSSIGTDLVALSDAVTISAGSTKASDEITIGLTGDLSGLTSSNGYLIPLQLTATGVDVSANRGVVYMAINVEESSAVFMTNFSTSDIQGSLISDRSGWSLISWDTSIYSGSYDLLFDGDLTSYIRTWGGPVEFVVDLGETVNMTGFYIAARNDYTSYASYQPNSITVATSTTSADSVSELGTPTYSEGALVRSVPYTYVALYVPVEVRYLSISADYGGSNMGTSEFNIYVEE